MRAQCGAGKQTGGEAGMLGGQAGHQGVAGGGLAVGTCQNLQANQQFVNARVRDHWQARNFRIRHEYPRG